MAWSDRAVLANARPIPLEAPVTKAQPKRARTKKGTYIADDKSTPDVNEAYVGGKTPNKKATKKAPAKKKTTTKKK